MKRRRHGFGLAILALVAMALAACSGQLSAGSRDDGLVLLTATGAIGASNRGGLDEFQDAFLGHKGAKFDKAYQFTRAQLEALGMHEMALQRANWPNAVTVRGPRFRDVLAAVKPQGARVILQALDGYQSTFPVAALQADTVILAIEADGKPLPIGGHGPTWLVFPAGVVPGDDASSDGGLAWSVFHIAIANP